MRSPHGVNIRMLRRSSGSRDASSEQRLYVDGTIAAINLAIGERARIVVEGDIVKLKVPAENNIAGESSGEQVRNYAPSNPIITLETWPKLLTPTALSNFKIATYTNASLFANAINSLLFTYVQRGVVPLGIVRQLFSVLEEVRRENPRLGSRSLSTYISVHFFAKFITPNAKAPDETMIDISAMKPFSV